MAMTDDTKTVKKKTPVANYKSMTRDTTQAPSPTNPIMVQKKDGSVGQWGNDLNAPQPATPAGAPKPGMSDKATGKSNAYYPANGQQSSPAVPAKKKSANYF